MIVVGVLVVVGVTPLMTQDIVDRQQIRKGCDAIAAIPEKNGSPTEKMMVLMKKCL